MNEDNSKSGRPVKRLPPWLKKTLPRADSTVSDCLDDLKLGTVCRSARCPNHVECQSKHRAAFLIMGPNCTRSCRFCAVPEGEPAPLDPEEPQRLAMAVKRLGLRHAVVTSVTRDDLPDGGASHFAAVATAIRSLCPGTTVEFLVPDFWGDQDAWEIVSQARPEVFNHNMETVLRLYPDVRPQADYDRSLALLDFAKERDPDTLTKSGLMLGLGEELDEVLEVAEDLRGVGVDMITVGQYLSPAGGRAIPVARFVSPEEFATLADDLRDLGFRHVACSPFTRSSHDASEALEEARK